MSLVLKVGVTHIIQIQINSTEVEKQKVPRGINSLDWKLVAVVSAEKPGVVL